MERGGDQFGQQVNAKFVQPIGERSSISSFFDYNLTQSYLYQDMSFDMLKNGGYGIDNFTARPTPIRKPICPRFRQMVCRVVRCRRVIPKCPIRGMHPITMAHWLSVIIWAV